MAQPFQRSKPVPSGSFLDAECRTARPSAGLPFDSPILLLPLVPYTAISVPYATISAEREKMGAGSAQRGDRSRICTGDASSLSRIISSREPNRPKLSTPVGHWLTQAEQRTHSGSSIGKPLFAKLITSMP